MKLARAPGPDSADPRTTSRGALMIQGLTPDRWTVLSAYFDEVLNVPDSARLAWLEGLRARAPAVADELEVLLAEYDRVGEEGFLERALPPRATLEGQALGAYTLIKPLGQGGMGSVWLARRSDGRYEGQAAGSS